MAEIRGPSEGARSTREFDSQNSDDYNKLAKIIIDEPAEVDALDFERFSQNLANIIRGTDPPRFAVGIFGKWGTGKTTLMRMIERELNPFLILAWDHITEFSEERNNLESFLKDNYKKYPISNSRFVKENDKTLTFKMEDDKKFFHRSSTHSLSLQLNDKKDKASLTIDGNFIRNFVVKKEEGNILKLYLELQNEVLTVWFDAWRYEREKRLAVIPFLRQIKIALENDLAKNTKAPKWDILREGLRRTFAAYIESTQLSFAVPGSSISTTTNLEEFVSSFKSNGSVNIDDERVPFHEHSTDYLKSALEKLEEEFPGSRIVVFVDDLDRCTPEKALEVLESIKAFFDIRGIVYVIGMDSESIDHIIKQKYGEDSHIKGLDYLQKIVQLPFQIPVRGDDDISESIQKIIQKELMGSKLADKLLQSSSKELIVKAIEANPRQLKRFVNNIILAKSVFFSNKSDENIEIDKLVAVQALNFRPEWNRFLQLITPNPIRKLFFTYYYLPLKNEGKLINSEEAFANFKKEKDNDKRSLPDIIIDIFQELVKQENDNLRRFLAYAGADEILNDIDKMEKYRRALEATKFKEGEKQLKEGERQWSGKAEPFNKLFLQLLSAGEVSAFNDMRSMDDKFPPNLSNIDLSNADLTGADLSGANLSDADLSFANLGTPLTSADLSDVDLSSVELSSPTLTGVNLSGAKLLEANLSAVNHLWANLDIVNLSSANLYRANLSGANLSGANLSGANLQWANLSYTNLLVANLSGANLLVANLSGANLLVANLSGAKLKQAHLSNANLSNANLSNADLSYANLSNANLFYANLSYTYLLLANLSNVDLSNANLGHSIMIGTRYQHQGEYFKCVDADLEGAIIDDENLSIVLKDGNAKNVPPAAENKKELRKRLEDIVIPTDVVDYLLSHSSLRD